MTPSAKKTPADPGTEAGAEPTGTDRSTRKLSGEVLAEASAMALDSATTKQVEVEDLMQQMSDCMVVYQGGPLGLRVNLEPLSTVVIGREPHCDFALDDASMSRRHCEVRHGGDRVIIRDLGSANGTLVNNRAVDEQVIRDGDMIQLGSVVFKFLDAQNPEHTYHKKLHYLSTTDFLTRAYNKRHLLELLQREAYRADRYGRDLALVMLDIDHFKQINDQHGHLAGDFVLKRLVEVIRAKIRQSDALGRFGGEEFAVVLPEVSAKGGFVLGEKLRRLVEAESFVFGGTTIRVTISLGVAT